MYFSQPNPVNQRPFVFTPFLCATSSLRLSTPGRTAYRHGINTFYFSFFFPSKSLSPAACRCNHRRKMRTDSRGGGRRMRERCKNDKLVKPRVTPVSAFSHKENAWQRQNTHTDCVFL